MITNVTDNERAQAATIEALRHEVTAWSVTATNLEAERDALKALTLKLAIGVVALAYEAGALFSVDEVRELMNPFESQVDSIFAGDPSFEAQVSSILKEANHAI